MHRLFADENFDLPVVEELRRLGHDVMTAQEAGVGGQGIPDPDIFALATSLNRAVLTFNRRHFRRLHLQVQPHRGIVLCTWDADKIALAHRIHQNISSLASLDNLLIKIYRPAKP
jgi:Domain of unknown function (DUF5615)